MKRLTRQQITDILNTPSRHEREEKERQEQINFLESLPAGRLVWINGKYCLPKEHILSLLK